MQTQPYPERGQGPVQTTSSAAINSLLVADCGSVFTKVSLFGLVEGQYRLMARGEVPTTINAPQRDITVGIIQAINTVEFITGRRLVAGQRIISPEEPDGDGVDVFVTTISAGGPLRLLVLGAVDQTLSTSIAQTLAGLYTEVHALPAPSYIATTTPTAVGAGASGGIAGMGHGWTQDQIAQEWERQFAQIRALHPHAALIIGMADGPAGANPLQEACQLLLQATQERTHTNGESKHISVLYAGAPQYVEAVRQMVQSISDVTRLDPITSPAQVGSVSPAVGALHERNVLKRIPGYEQLLTWASAAPIATATSLSSLVRFLAQHYAMNVTAIDVGGANTTLLLAGEQGEFLPNINAGIGMGPGIGAILQQVGFQRIARWLPFNIREEELRQFALDRMQHPEVIPTEAREVQICHAFAREAIILTRELTEANGNAWQNSDLILATGGVLSRAPKYGQVVMMLLDALQPQGVTSLVLDRVMLTQLLGAVASVAPMTAVQVNENDAVTYRLGTCVVPFGGLQPGQTAVRVGVEYTNGRQVNVDVMAGSIEVIPLDVNEQALLTLYPAPTVDVGLGPGERARAAEEIDGGLVGLIIDARGRPLVLPTNDTERHARLLQWAQALGIE